MSLKQIFVCTERRCGWRGTADELLRAPNPFDEVEYLRACPKCKSIDSFEAECQVDGCTRLASCGTPTREMGYIRCCGPHFTQYGYREPKP